MYAAPPMNGMGGAPHYQQAPYTSQGLYGQQPGMGAYPTPRDPYGLPAAPQQAPGMPAHGYGSPVSAQDMGYAAWPHAAHGKPEHGGQHYAAGPAPGQPPPGAPWPGTAPHAVQQVAGPAHHAPAQGGAPGQAAEEPDPDDDPNRLPTFVKVRGLPAEHDPRIARRPKPKKRAPGICCA